MRCARHFNPLENIRNLRILKRGGLRVIYFWWEAGEQFWLFTLYDKDEMDDLSPTEKRALRATLKMELDARR